MKKYIVTLGLILFIATSGIAQDYNSGAKRRSPEERAKIRTETLAEKLDLTADQKEKVYTLHLEQAKHRESFRSEARDEARKRFKDRREVLKKEEDKLNDILTDTQKQKYKELKEHRKEELKERRKKRGDIKEK